MDLERYYGRARYLVSRSGRFGTGPSPAAADTESRRGHQNQTQTGTDPNPPRSPLSSQEQQRQEKNWQQNGCCGRGGNGFCKDDCDLISSRRRCGGCGDRQSAGGIAARRSSGKIQAGYGGAGHIGGQGYGIAGRRAGSHGGRRRGECRRR